LVTETVAMDARIDRYYKVLFSSFLVKHVQRHSEWGKGMMQKVDHRFDQKNIDRSAEQN
jgi:hypothetical protein